jgi:hypothetical protein
MHTTIPALRITTRCGSSGLSGPKLRQLQPRHRRQGLGAGPGLLQGPVEDGIGNRSAEAQLQLAAASSAPGGTGRTVLWQ